MIDFRLVPALYSFKCIPTSNKNVARAGTFFLMERSDFFIPHGNANVYSYRPNSCQEVVTY